MDEMDDRKIVVLNFEEAPPVLGCASVVTCLQTLVADNYLIRKNAMPKQALQGGGGCLMTDRAIQC